MLKVFVDSGSSIKQEEKEKYNVEIIPLKILLSGKEYQDSVDLSHDVFYEELITKKQFPMTSLPELASWQDKIEQLTQNGDDVIIVTISSKISGTYNAIRLMFENNPKVRVIDSMCAVGGMRLIIDEINMHREESLDEIVKHVEDFIPRIKVLAIPETLTYLHRGGRLSSLSFVIGTALKINPVITFKNGSVSVETKKRGILAGMQYIVDSLKNLVCDIKYEIIASYTKQKENLEKLVSMLEDKYKKRIKIYDNLTPAIAGHWGPNAFGLIFVTEKKK